MDKKIKVLYPSQADRKVFMQNEINILSRLKPTLLDAVENGIVDLIESGTATWKHDDDAKSLPDRCLVIVYTYGTPLFPILRRSVEDSDRIKLFWFFSQMVSVKTNVFNFLVKYLNIINFIG